MSVSQKKNTSNSMGTRGQGHYKFQYAREDLIKEVALELDFEV